MLTTIAHSLTLFENTLWLAIWRIFSQSKCFKLEADLIYFANDGHSGETLIKVPSLNFFTLWKSITQTNERTSKLRWEQVELGCVGGGGQVVSMLVFYSDDLSLNPAEVCNYYLQWLEKNEYKQKTSQEWAIYYT